MQQYITEREVVPRSRALLNHKPKTRGDGLETRQQVEAWSTLRGLLIEAGRAVRKLLEVGENETQIMNFQNNEHDVACSNT